MAPARPASAASPASAGLTLLTGPPGSGKSEVALARIREAATVAGPRGRSAGGTDSALLVLPTYGAAQHALRSALTRWDARGLFDAPFVTFTSAGERFLPGFRVRSLPSAEERDRLMERALEETDPPAFRAARAHRGLRARLLRLLKDVKQGVLAVGPAFAALAERAARLALGPRERLEGFLLVSARYGALLERADLEDHEDALQRLRQALEAGPPALLPSVLAVDGFDDMTPVEEAILLALARHIAQAGGDVLVTLPYEAARADLFASAGGLRARLLGAGFVEQRLEGFRRAPGGALERLALGYGGAGGARASAGAQSDQVQRLTALDPSTGSGSSGPGAQSDQVQLLTALDADDEDDVVAREVRRLLDEGAPLVRGARDILVVLPDLEGRGPGMARALERLGVPTHRSGARPLAAEPWVRALEAPLTVLAGRVDAGELAPERVLDTLRQRALGGDLSVSLAALDAQEMRWRGEGFPAGWAGLRAAADEALRPLLEVFEEQRLALAHAHGEVSGALLAALDLLVPLPGSAGLDADGMPRDRVQDRALAAALAARLRVRALAHQRLEAAARVGAETSGPEAAADLLEALARAAFEVGERRLDVVHLLDPEEARGWEAAVVIVAGLEERSLPRRAQEDPLLADAERGQLGGEGLALPTAREREARERRRVLALLTRARKRLVLSHPTLTPEGDPLPPSRVIAQVTQLVTLVPRPRVARVAPGAPALAACRSAGDLLRFAASRTARPGEAPEEGALARALLWRLDPELLLRAARWRRAAADALPVEALARFRASVETVSPSKLNEALTCAQRHFLMRVVGVEQDEAPVAGPEFGARELGKVVHAALHLALREPGLAPAEVAEAALAAEPVKGFDRSATAAEVARVVALFRDREAGIGGEFRPDLAWLEGALGGRAGVVELGPEGARFRLRGRVDRVDVARRGSRALVVDYKLGTARPAEAAKATQAGRDLQLPLYARALEVGHALEVVGLEWVSALGRVRRDLLSAEAPEELSLRAEGPKAKVLDPEAFRTLLRLAESTAGDVVARVRAGDHALEPFDEEACDTCPVRAVCRPDRQAVSRAAARRKTFAVGEEEA